MPKGEKTKSPTDPEENRKYHDRRDKNNESARKHRLGQKRKIEDGENCQKLLKEAQATIEKLENELRKSQLNMCPCTRSTNHFLPVAAYQAAPSSMPIHNPYPTATHYMPQPNSQPHDSYSESTDSGTDDAFDSPQPVFPDEQNGWIDHSHCIAPAHPQGYDTPLTYAEMGAYNQNLYQQPRDSYSSGAVGQSAINPGAATTVAPSMNMPNRAAPVPSMGFTMSPPPARLNNTGTQPFDFSNVPPQQPTNFEKVEECSKFWEGKFPPRNSVGPGKKAEEKNSPLTDLIKRTIPRNEIPVLSVDIVEKTLSPSFDKMSVRG